MLLERWFRSEAQQEIRVQLKQASDNVDHLLTRLKSYEERLTLLRGTVRDLALFLHHETSSTTPSPNLRARKQDETHSHLHLREESDRSQVFLRLSLLDSPHHYP
jgi:hypothetical protein